MVAATQSSSSPQTLRVDTILLSSPDDVDLYDHSSRRPDLHLRSGVYRVGATHVGLAAGDDLAVCCNEAPAVVPSLVCVDLEFRCHIFGLDTGPK